MDRASHLDSPSRPDAGDPPARARAGTGMLTQVELVTPEQANHYGTLFAPNGLALLGKMAFLAATRFTGQPVVMAAANRIDFARPVPVGSLLQFSADVVRVGRSSMTVRVTARFDAACGTCPDDVLRGEFELVAVDANGRPCAVSPPESRGEEP